MARPSLQHTDGRVLIGQPLPHPGWFYPAMKRTVDVVLSAGALLLLSPIMAAIGGILLGSRPRTVFYCQERIGKDEKRFTIWKFRTMVVDAETNIPLLTVENDKRITNFGRFLRRYHFDELPQIFQVLRGEMTLVGPRPERRYFIDLIIDQAPHYRMLLGVKPGLTSWGTVTFGYADTVEKMIERSYLDLVYLHRASIVNDFRIMMRTLQVVWRANGI